MSRFTRPTSAAGWALAGLWTLYLAMWLGGVGAYVLLGGVPPGDEWTAPLFLTLAGLIVLTGAPARRRAGLLAAGVLGFLAEWIGLRTGMLFGVYRYTDVLAPLVFDVPLVMISAWMVLVAYVDDLLRIAGWRAPSRIAGGAALLTAIDLIIDPLAAGPLRYWTWADGGAYYGIPAHNFAGWFAVGAIVLGLLQTLRSGGPSAVSLHAGLSIVLFFTILAAAFGLVLPALAGLAIGGFHAWATRRPERLVT